MGTDVITVNAGGDWSEALQQAVACLRDGGLVVFPTETVYGVAARLDDEHALQRLTEVKGRSDTKPFTVHIGSPSSAEQYVPKLSATADRFIRKGWPGPITLILATDPAKVPALSRLSDASTRAVSVNNTIGLRCPANPFTSELLDAVKAPVIASSANRAANPPPYDAPSVLKDLDGLVDLLIDAGRTRYAKPSTIVRVNETSYDLLREGVYDERMVHQLAQLRILFVCTGNTCRSPMAAAMAEKFIANRIGCSPTELADRGIEVDSAGIAGGGVSATPEALAAMAGRGLDISTHKPKPLTKEVAHRADYIYAMTSAHREAVTHIAPSAADRVSVLSGKGDISDPFGGSQETYEACAKAIEEALRARMQEVTL